MTTTSDDFNRANGALGTSSSGHVWTILPSCSVAISSNQALFTRGASAKMGAYIEHGSPDGTYKVDILTHSGQNYGGLLLRYIDINNFIRAWIYDDGVTWELYIDMYVAGVYSNPVAAITTSGSDGTLQAILDGSTLTVSYPGTVTQIITVSNVTGTKHGIYGDGGDPGASPSFFLDNWFGDIPMKSKIGIPI